MRARAIIAGLSLVALALGGCSSKPQAEDLSNLRGGTLRVGYFYDPDAPFDTQFLFNFGAEAELLRCCLTRTLLSYNGKPTSQGGAELRPDLAVALPTVSADSLTWTFTLRAGLRYAPPLQRTPIVARDIARAIERALRAAPRVNEFNETRTGGYTATYLAEVIAGADDYTAGRSRVISGIETPDARTIRFHLLQPTGDFGYRLSFPLAAPIPPDPANTRALGVAEGHDIRLTSDDTSPGYGKFLVASGPYMVEGSEAIDFSAPPALQKPAAGWRRTSLTLVRNPSWKSSTDPLRPAFADRIVLIQPKGEDDAALVSAVERGDFDVMFEEPIPASVAERYRTTPSLKGRLFSIDFDSIRFLKPNIAVAPFDDVHVRKAMNYVVDKPRLLQMGRGGQAHLTGHIALDSEQGNVLASYDPFGTTDGPDLDRARAEMRLSRYDKDGDGMCDAPACRSVRAAYRAPTPFPAREITQAIGEDLAKIGITISPVALDFEHYFAESADASQHLPLAMLFGWSKDYPNASTFFPGLFGGTGISNGVGESLLGATPAELKGWGYTVTSVPSIDAQIRQCLQRSFSAQTRCWIELDQYMMEQLVPIVPIFAEITARVVSERVASFSFDQAWTMPALDRIALKPEARSSPSPSPTGSGSSP